MSICDLTIATGGTAMVKAAYSSGKPAYGVGAGNATVVVDETADLAEAAMNTRISKTQNHGSGCSCDGNLLVEATVYDTFLELLQKEGGYLASAEEKSKLEAVMWDADGHRTIDTVARAAGVIAEKAGLHAAGRQVLHHREGRQRSARRIASRARSCRPCWRSSSTAASTPCSRMVSEIFEVGGKGHSVGIASFDDDHIHRLASMAPVSRIMVRAAERARQRRVVHQRHAADRQSRMRHLGWQHHEREHQCQALHEHDLGEPADSRGQAERAGLLGEFYNSETFEPELADRT